VDRNKWNFVIKYGIVRWGIPVWLVTTLLYSFPATDASHAFMGPFNEREFVKHLCVGFFVFVIGGGSLFGLYFLNLKQGMQARDKD